MASFFLNNCFFFSNSAYRKYLTATYSYDYKKGGEMDYDKIHAANPGTTAMTPVTRRQTIPTNYPVATREDNKAVSKSYLEWVFFLSHMDGVHFLFIFFMRILSNSIWKGWFFFVHILDNYNCNRFSKSYLVDIGNNAWIIHHTHSNEESGQQVKKMSVERKKNW